MIWYIGGHIYGYTDIYHYIDRIYIAIYHIIYMLYIHVPYTCVYTCVYTCIDISALKLFTLLDTYYSDQ